MRADFPRTGHIETGPTVGAVYGIPPQPPVPENTRVLDAGALWIGVEYRDVDPAALRTTYAGNAAHLAELEEKSPPGGFFDEGVSVHVYGADDGHEYLRFDLFDSEPHYHYNHRPGPEGSVVNNVVPFDVTAGGDMLDWAFTRLRDRLPHMLTKAGGEHLVPHLDAAVLEPALTEAQALAVAARSAYRRAARR
ncbi:DUF7700 domain-containing protein [Yinghuangia seranimata]|uniref:DUF7700 domain-containing protein n=1 Tax=Yinghuangia seranimata TaxID=408067 RepID=UPI00248BE7DE|nr:hypothetical protein [Yinghuangia seranimata]MDI2127177.1 hypothetical protein [Yinghuangia seranimata]